MAMEVSQNTFYPFCESLRKWNRFFEISHSVFRFPLIHVRSSREYSEGLRCLDVREEI